MKPKKVDLPTPVIETDKWGRKTMKHISYTAEQIEYRRWLFMEAVKGLTASAVAHALNLQTPGHNWMSCSKGHMATDYARYDIDERSDNPPWVDLEKLHKDAIAAHLNRRLRGLTPL